MTLSFGSAAVCTAAAYVGKKEKAGPLGDWFDNYSDDTTFGEDSWEKAETQLQKRAMRAAADRAGLSYADIDVFFGGDLQAQCTATAYAVRDAALYRPLRRLLDPVAGAAAGGGVGRGQLCGAGSRRHQQPLRGGRAAVPLSA